MTSRSEPMDLIVSVKGREYRLRPGKVWSVGRDASCDIVVNHQSVSRKHGEFIFAGADWTYRDLASANHTWLAGQPIEDVVISRAVELRLGRDTDRKSVV
jgi:ABC transport system ATP-binding/permease protein